MFFAVGDRLSAYAIDDGSQVWDVSAVPIVEPAAGDGMLFITETAQIQALRIENGNVAWRLPFAEPLAARPVWEFGRLIVLTKKGSVIAIEGTEGTILWRRDLGVTAHAPAAQSADRVYVPSANGHLLALDAANGETVWNHRLPSAINDVLVSGDRIYAGSDDNFFYCFLTRDGRVDWRWRTGGDVIGKPTADENNVYFVSLDNVLRAHDRATGVQQWIRALPLRPTTGPLLTSGTLVVTGISGTVRGFKAEDGTPTGEQNAGAELGAPTHAVPENAAHLPRLLVVTRDIAKGATAILYTRRIDPEARPLTPLAGAIVKLPPLPNLGEPLER
jgi:outer membrane protein assembly factor BamB